jgi:16S rRNA (cytosine1402-N4)-methyltransferase
VGHQPVLADEVTNLLVPALEGGGVFVDATLGRGGHASRLLDAAPKAYLVGIDRDPDALTTSRANLAAYEGRFTLVRDEFSRLPSILERLGIASVRGVLLDLGVSSPQLDEAHRGFSFRDDGPLDMRMDPAASLTAHAVVNTYPAARLEQVIARFGEERFARRVARGIVSARPIEGTVRLAEIIKEAIPAATRRTGGHPARRTFQAIRLEVNGELDALTAVLPGIFDVSEPGGRSVVISYHSLEDRIVKRSFQDEARGCICPIDFPVCRCGAQARVRILTRKPVKAGTAELESNPRARSAKLRAAERISVDAQPADEQRRSA